MTSYFRPTEVLEDGAARLARAVEPDEVADVLEARERFVALEELHYGSADPQSGQSLGVGLKPSYIERSA